MPSSSKFQDPARDCRDCPRLAGFRADNRRTFPDWHNATVPAIGHIYARLFVFCLAPGLRVANRTGRPFTGDHAGDLLYATLAEHGFAKGEYGQRADDGFELLDCRVSNAVRCVPPANKPTGPEIRACNGFLKAEIEAMPKLTTIIALGGVSHGAVLAALGFRKAAHPFRHGARHELGRIRLFDSYHCSRYNTNTRRLTTAMFSKVFQSVRANIDGC